LEQRKKVSARDEKIPMFWNLYPPPIAAALTRPTVDMRSGLEKISTTRGAMDNFSTASELACSCTL
jgi:hypothetical protein